MKAVTLERKRYWRYIYFFMRWCGECPSVAKRLVIEWDSLGEKQCPAKARKIVRYIKIEKRIHR